MSALHTYASKQIEQDEDITEQSKSNNNKK